MDDLSKLKLKQLRRKFQASIDEVNKELKQKVVEEYHMRFRNSNGDKALERAIIDDLLKNDCELLPAESVVAFKMEMIMEEQVPAQTSLSAPLRFGSNAEKIGSPFTNPYTFIPFPDKGPEKHSPTPLTAAEEDPRRISGVLEFEVTTESSLMTLEANEYMSKEKHRFYRALRIGDSVIYPATGVRGTIRHLMTILVGGSLRYLDMDAYLCDGRWDSNEKQKKNLQLGRIIKVGNRNVTGKIMLGSQKSIPLKRLTNAGISDQHRESDCPIWVKWDGSKSKPDIRTGCRKQPQGFDKMLKLSGKPINYNKNEWVFTPDLGRIIDVPPGLWSAYYSRYQHGPHSELRKDQLIWLEPRQEGEHIIISDAGEIESLQYARWGKEGDRLSEKVPFLFRPCYTFGKEVDEVTDIFGQVPPDKEFADTASSFAGRIRPDNVVFMNASSSLQTVTLAPLMPPHPGNKAFYRNLELDNDNDNPEMKLRGYKVYRTTVETGVESPMNYDQQPVMHDGMPKEKHQSVNKTVEVLPKGSSGKLSISITSLTKREYALLRMVTEMPLRFGGGKPFGMGLCRLKLVSVMDELGRRIPDPVEEWKNLVSDLKDRMLLYLKSQEPVKKLRYPMCAEENNKTVVRAGHVWFNRFASYTNGRIRPMQVEKGSLAESMLEANELEGQPLPELNLEAEEAMLYGYDVLIKTFLEDSREKKRILYEVEPFDSERHIQEHHRSGPNISMNSEKRGNNRAKR